MGTMKTPGVYIVEKSAFPNSVVEVATAVPAFIGYTEKADNKGKSLLNQPWRITSMSEFENYFGRSAPTTFSLTPATDTDTEKSPTPPNFSVRIQGKMENFCLEQASGKFLLYRSMRLFYQNGGGPCYIVSVGTYNTTTKGAEAETDDKQEVTVEADPLKKGMEKLLKEQEPTMVVIPDAVLLGQSDCITVQQAALAHCDKMRNRVAILDVYDGMKERTDTTGDCIAKFRNALGINHLDFAMAYYPWLHTTIVQDNELSYQNIEDKDKLVQLILNELAIPKEGQDPPEGQEKGSEKTVQQRQAILSIKNDTAGWEKELGDKVKNDVIKQHKTLLNKSLIAMSPVFKQLLSAMKHQLNILPPAAAMAGVYTMVDNSRGVWKAPANVSLNAVVSPTVNITRDDQEDLNVTTQGKSINAIRPFIGEGTLVWGARTLDGNSLDWRYIQVRRTMIMLEESIRLASKAYVFENNTANTWVTIKSMISNFLTGIWKRGGLAGASPTDAFSVHVGLGETMTPEDILEGILRITVLVALVRPAEFIEITFQQQMQKS